MQEVDSWRKEVPLGQISTDKESHIAKRRAKSGVLDSVRGWAMRGDLIGLQRGLDRGDDPNTVDSAGRTALMNAVIDRRMQLVELLLIHNAEVNLQDEAGNSALHFAAQSNDLITVRLLLKRGAQVDATDVHGNTPLWRAVFNSQGQTDVIKALLEAGADKNRKNKHGMSVARVVKTISNFDFGDVFD